MTAIARVVFFGSPEFAVPTLRALSETSYRPYLVVSQPSRPAGRGRRMREPAVARWARQHAIEVAQPAQVRAAEFLDTLRSSTPDIAVVVAFGQIFPAALLELPRFGCVNLHASLLPRFRGAAPIQAAIAGGEKETGVTTMVMEAGLDTGPTLLQERVALDGTESSPQLAGRLAEIGGPLMIETLAGLESGTLEPLPQDDERASWAPRLDRDDGIVDWNVSAVEIERRFRAFQPWPGLTASCRERPLKLVDVEVLEDLSGAEAPPGTFLGVHGGALAVACGRRSALGLRAVQRAGKRALQAVDFLNGEPLQQGALEFATPGTDIGE